ncbi:MAG: glutamate-5-semialdehyde dehydrogenase [Methylotenera sp.]|nr:glutamate-5-semialdehyde dehydrogenase [Oligoflexia bacterium]
MELPGSSEPLGASDLQRLQASHAAARQLRTSTADRRNAVLLKAAELLKASEAELLKANQEDLISLAPTATSAFRDRLALSAARIEVMAVGLRQVAAFSDPLTEVVEQRTLPNGLNVRKVRSPLGVILMIFESRPNVAIEAFSLAFKSGNVILLRGGKESMRTTGKLYEILTEALRQNGFAEDCLWGITNPDRKLTLALLQQRGLIDVVVPRGGDALIEFVVTNSKIPIIKNDRGMCHVYVDQEADQEMAIQIVLNAKIQRPGVCNAMETLLVHEKIKAEFIPKLFKRMSTVEWRADFETLALVQGPNVQAATPESWDTEYLDLVMNCRVVKSLEEAIAHIEAHGSRHSEAIITRTETAARKFQAEVDAAAVYWNASTRFTDGFELGLGGELGISTQKLHVRGPVGLKELTSIRWIFEGTGQVRR